MTILPVIIAGGAGQRLWPLSLPEKPKPFVALLPDGSTLFERTLQRALAINGFVPLVVCNAAHRDLAVTQMAGGHIDLLLEPVQRDTAAAVCAAALWTELTHGSGVVVAIMPADHHVDDSFAFAETIRRAAVVAQSGSIITVAILPTRAATEFGYLALGNSNAEGFHEVQTFIEKPDEAKAAQLIAGQNFWNAGLFVARTEALIGAFERHAPDILEACRKALGEVNATKSILDAGAFGTVRKISFDHAVMEKHDRVAAVKAGFQWQDLGNWAAVHGISPQDASGNCTIGHAQVHDCRSVYLRADTAALVAKGCNDLVVVEANGKILVMRLQLSAGLRDATVLPVRIIKGGHSLRLPVSWCGGSLDIAVPEGRDLTLTAHSDNPV